ncbi:tetraspanin-2 isoform X2 [Chelonia mydas]|uniref:tetraspanin-2 isoform X2 n=1 Tax=Chelonia mydas TaxID=8469 RepID=UPI001CA9E5F0|nr:tetraspanin-2 isoform X2 [Chelonia mydas]
MPGRCWDPPGGREEQKPRENRREVRGLLRSIPQLPARAGQWLRGGRWEPGAFSLQSIPRAAEEPCPGGPGRLSGAWPRLRARLAAAAHRQGGVAAKPSPAPAPPPAARHQGRALLLPAPAGPCPILSLHLPPPAPRELPASRGAEPEPAMGRLRCIKFLLFAFNFVFWLAGLAVIAFGLWLRFGGVLRDLTSEEKSPEYFYMGLYVLVGAGALMMTVGFFGCCGAVRESQCLLGAFFACLLVIFAAEVTAGVFAFIGKKAAVQEVQTIYEEAYKDYVLDMGKSNKTLIQFHTALQCCGKESEVQVKPTCPEGIQVPKNCLDEIQNLINSNLHLVGIVGIGIAGITIFGMIFSMVLCCAIRNTRDML